MGMPVAVLAALSLGQPAFQPLGDLPGGGIGSSAYGVSDDGRVVVGISETDVSGNNSFQGFIWTSGSGMALLSVFQDDVEQTYPTDVSSNGTRAAGTAYRSIGGDRAAVWLDGQQQLLPVPPGHAGGGANAISADGSTVAGFSRGVLGNGEPCLWVGGMPILLFGDAPHGWVSSLSADGTVAAGQASSPASGPTSLEGFIWTESRGVVWIGDLEGYRFESWIFGLSPDGGVAVGQSATEVNGASTYLATRWTEQGGLESIGDLPGGATWGRAAAASLNGRIIVGQSESAAGVEAFVWDAQNGMRALADVLTNEYGVDLEGWTLTTATDISSNGRHIVGFGSSPVGHQEAWIATLDWPCSDADITTTGTTNNLPDGVVDISDYSVYLINWAGGQSTADMTTTGSSNGIPDGVVDVSDFSFYLTLWSAGCP